MTGGFEMFALEAHLGGFSGVMPGRQRRLEDSLHLSGVRVAETGVLACSVGSVATRFPESPVHLPQAEQWAVVACCCSLLML